MHGLDAIKKQVRVSKIDDNWSSWTREHSNKELDLDFSDPEFSIPELPEQVAYMKDPLTGKDLFAYPALCLHSGYYEGEQYKLQYFQDKEKAEESHKNTMTHIEEAVKEAEHQRHLEVMQSELHKVQEDITLLIEESEPGAGEKPWLKNHAPHDLDTLRTKVKEALEVAHHHAPDAEELLTDLRKKVADIYAVESDFQETNRMVIEKIKKLLIEKSNLDISPNESMYALQFGDVYIKDAIKDRISFAQYQYNSNEDRYAVAAELSASDSNGNNYLVAQLIVRDDGLIRVTDYATDAIESSSEYARRSPEDGTRYYDVYYDYDEIWTGEQLNPDSFTIKDYNIAPERVSRTISGRKDRPSRRQRQQRRPSRETEDVIVSNANANEEDQGLNPMQAAFQEALNKSRK